MCISQNPHTRQIPKLFHSFTDLPPLQTSIMPRKSLNVSFKLSCRTGIKKNVSIVKKKAKKILKQMGTKKIQKKKNKTVGNILPGWTMLSKIFLDIVEDVLSKK